MKEMNGNNIEVKVESSFSIDAVSANAVSQTIGFEAKGEEGNLDVEIYSLLGGLILEKVVKINSNNTSFFISTKEIGEGEYVINFRKGDYSKAEKVLIHK